MHWKEWLHSNPKHILPQTSVPRFRRKSSESRSSTDSCRTRYIQISEFPPLSSLLLKFRINLPCGLHATAPPKPTMRSWLAPNISKSVKQRFHNRDWHRSPSNTSWHTMTTLRSRQEKDTTRLEDCWQEPQTGTSLQSCSKNLSGCHCSQHISAFSHIL